MIERVKFVHVLALILVFMAAGMVALVMISPDYKDSDLRTQAATAVLLAFAAGYGYFLNSTSGSDKKTDIIAQSQPVEQKEHV